MKKWKDIALLLGLIALIIVGAIVVRGCRRTSPIVFPSAPAIAIPSQTPSPSPSPEVRADSSSMSSALGTQKTVVRIPQAIASNGTKPEDITIEFEQTLGASSSSSASASFSPSNEVEKPEVATNLSIGVIAGTMPGTIALDYKVMGLGPFGLDVQGNHRQVGAGVSIGQGLFGEVGGFQGFDGSRGLYVGGGARLAF